MNSTKFKFPRFSVPPSGGEASGANVSKGSGAAADEADSTSSGIGPSVQDSTDLVTISEATSRHLNRGMGGAAEATRAAAIAIPSANAVSQLGLRLSTKAPAPKKTLLDKINFSIDSNLFYGHREKATAQQRQWSLEHSATRAPRDSRETPELQLQRSNTVNNPNPGTRSAKINMALAKDSFRDDSFAEPNSREFLRMGKFSAPERARGLEPETRMHSENAKAAEAAVKSHADGAGHKAAVCLLGTRR